MPRGGREQTVDVEGRRLKFTNLDKPLYPAAGFTKGQVLDYYIRVAPCLLPHLKDRPVTLKRYPNGVGGEFFYEKDAPRFTPEWVRTFPVPRRAGGTPIRYIIIDDLATLVWCANLASLEIHPFLHRAPTIETPDVIAFDLDPGEGSSLPACIEVAFLVRALFDRMRMKCFAKVSGSKGIQIYVPLNGSNTYAATQTFARAVAQYLEKKHPKLIVSEMAKVARRGKVFIDWSQNSDFKTTVAVYSLRAKRPHPFVSVPVSWDELDSAVQAEDTRLYFPPAAALDRCERLGDLWADALTLKQQLPAEFSAPETAPRASRSAPLEEYQRKRDFSITAELPPALRASRQGSRRRFVVQKHDASHLHYDFRLEIGGTLKSWAVPKGPPYALEERRLARETEDHPVEYLDFEGVIPQGQYGGGTVMVWDIGTYELVEGNYWKGNLRVYLAGKKLKGEWSIQRDPAVKGNWALVKTGKAMRRISAKRDDQSALTGRTMSAIAAEKDKVWHSNRVGGVTLDQLPEAAAQFIAPMQALLVSQLPQGDEWRYEIKLDGYRALAVRTGDGLQLLSRRNNSLNDRFPAVAEACAALPPDTVLDGEVVALDEQGRPSFPLLQNRRDGSHPVLFYIFDALVYGGRSLLHLPLEARVELAARALEGVGEPVRMLGFLSAPAQDLVAAAKEQGLEGIVAKKKHSLYESGQRSGAWVKFKTNQGQELIAGGYIPGKDGFDALLVGYYDEDRLLFLGKLKNGFDPRSKREVAARFGAMASAECPFANLPEPKGARRGEALTAAVMAKCRWLRPELVVQVEFTDWTRANHLRHSRFAGLRDDKDPREVRKEQPDT